VRASFRVRSFGLEQLQLSPSTILAPDHRSDNDVPLLVSTLGPRWTEMDAAGLLWTLVERIAPRTARRSGARTCAPPSATFAGSPPPSAPAAW
jgi:hypothetical protein